MRKIVFLAAVLACCNMIVLAQSPVTVYPTNWYAGMKNQNLQLMVHHPDIAEGATVSLSYPGVTLVKTNKVESPNYLFLDLKVTPAAKPGTCKITIKQKDNSYTINYELKTRRAG